MSQSRGPAVVGNDFVVAKPQLHLAAAVAGTGAVPSATAPLAVPAAAVPAVRPYRRFAGGWQALIDYLHDHSVITFCLLGLLVLGSGSQVAGMYWAHYRIFAPAPASRPSALSRLPGLNASFPAAGNNDDLQRLTSQTIELQFGDQKVIVDRATISGWLQITSDRLSGTDYVHVKSDAIKASLPKLGAAVLKPAVDQVTASHPDGSQRIIVAGRDGVELADVDPLVKQLATQLLGGHGLQLTVPTQIAHSRAVTPSVFDKLLEVDLTSKRMYAYDKGTLTKTFLVSAGAPVTPTPVGEFHVYAKLPVQDMSGFNANGSRYFQPHVRWVNYFYKDNAVHGNYWRPLSWFGNRNSSHGCVSLPDNEAEWVYDWAPIGTTVITYNE